MGMPLRDAGIGLVAAMVWAWPTTSADPRPGQLVGERRPSVYHDIIVPLFAMGLAAAIVLGFAAGVGEEWLFRGIVQPLLLGLVAASVLFGLAHVGSRRMLPFGVWATMGGSHGMAGVRD